MEGINGPASLKISDLIAKYNGKDLGKDANGVPYYADDITGFATSNGGAKAYNTTDVITTSDQQPSITITLWPVFDETQGGDVSGGGDNTGNISGSGDGSGSGVIPDIHS